MYGWYVHAGARAVHGNFQPHAISRAVGFPTIKKHLIVYDCARARAYLTYFQKARLSCILRKVAGKRKSLVSCYNDENSGCKPPNNETFPSSSSPSLLTNTPFYCANSRRRATTDSRKFWSFHWNTCRLIATSVPLKVITSKLGMSKYDAISDIVTCLSASVRNLI